MSIALPVVSLIFPLILLLSMRPSKIIVRGPHAWLGIRTGVTISSQQAWEIAHRRAWPYVVASSAVLFIIVLAVVAWVLAIPAQQAEHRQLLAGSGTTLGVVLWTAILIVGARVGHQAAKPPD